MVVHWHAGVVILHLSCDMIEIVDTKLWTLDLLPSCRQPLRLEGVGPVGGLGVVVNVILPAPHGPAHAPAGGGMAGSWPPTPARLYPDRGAGGTFVIFCRISI